MELRRFEEITGAYRGLTVAVIGDFCLDRYLHIDPALEEVSLETHLPAHQVVCVRPQAGGAGTVLANVAALGPAEVRAVGVAGDDGEGFELLRALRRLGANVKHFVRTRRRMTFTYTKPLVIRPGRPPEELSRLDIRDRTPLPLALVERLRERIRPAVCGADVVLLLEQVPQTPCGVLNPIIKRFLAELTAEAARPPLVLGDSRCDPGGFANAALKVNRDELRRHFDDDRGRVEVLARRWAKQIQRCVFVTLGDAGIVGAEPDGRTHRVAGIRPDGPVDVVGAGDAVLANLGMALGAGATVAEAMTLANLAGSIVVRKIGTTGTASIPELRAALARLRDSRDLGDGRTP